MLVRAFFAANPGQHHPIDMAQHAAPTSVTLAATEEETFLSRFVKRYWLFFAGLAAAATAAILFMQHREESNRLARQESWTELSAVVEFGDVPQENGMPSSTPFTIPAAGTLAALADDLGSNPSAPWAKALEVGRLLKDGKQEEGLQAAQSLENRWPEHLLSRVDLPFDSNGAAQPLAKHIETRMAQIQSWESAHPGLFANPDLPTDSPQVTLHTNRGDLVLGLYASDAPMHVENFLDQADSGNYTGTKFHRVIPGRTVHGGDPNSIEGEPETWGLGGGDGALEKESNALHNFEYVLGMDREVGKTEDSKRLFYITLSDQFTRDGQYTVFGTVLEGKNVLNDIATGALDGQRPQDPVIIESVDVKR